MALTRNVGSIDKIVRLVGGSALALWGVLGAGLSGPVGIVALVAGVVFITTALINFCPVFKILGISSFKA